MTKRDREKKRRERARLAYEDSLASTLRAEKARDRFDGMIEPTTGIWKISGERFNKRELIRLDALKQANPDVISHLVRKYKVEWWNVRDLQGYMSARYHGPRPADGIALPAEGYLWRACVAFQGGDSSEILDDGGPTGLGANRRSTCFSCKKKFAALCPRCRSKAATIVRKGTTPRKPVQPEQPPVQPIEVQR
jgi:hypothetical protein